MLRLAPTSIPLTRGEIAQYELRNEERRANQLARSSRRQVSSNYANSSIRSMQSHIWPGPQRSVTYHSGSEANSPHTENDDHSTHCAGSICSHPPDFTDTTLSANGDVSFSDKSAKRARSRRDSVLSSDCGSEGQQSSLLTSSVTRSKADLSPYLDGSRDELDVDTTEALLGLQLVNDRHEEYYSSKHYERRVSHGRSLSDPVEVASPHHEVRGSQSSRTSQREAISIDDHMNPEMGQHSGSNDQLGSSGLNHHIIRRKLLPSKHNRHHSMPNPLNQSPPRKYPVSPRGDTYQLHEHEEGSAISECLRNSCSPLEQLVEDAAALRMSSPHETPSPSINTRNVPARRIRFPSFADDDDSPVNGGLRGGAPDRGIDRSRDHHRDASTPVIHSRQTAPATASFPPRLRRVMPLAAYAEGPSWAPGRSMRAEFSLPQETRPAQHEHRQVPRPAIRRRPLPNVNQENGDEMAPLYAEREAWIARQMAPPQGRLAATPSPEGRLERLMR